MISQKLSKNGDCNTRSNPRNAFNSHLDYLRFRVDITASELDLLLTFVGGKYIGYEPDKIWSPGGATVFFNNKVIGVEGIKGGFNINEDTQQIDLMLEMTGQYFEGISLINQWRLLTGLHHRFGVTVKRIDLAVDDYTFSKIPVDQMRKAWEDGNSFYFKNYKYIESGTNRFNLKKTHYFGSRESSKIVRVYNHDNECLRFESEFKRELSNEIFYLIANISRDWIDEQVGLETIENWVESLHGCNKSIDKESLVKSLHGCGGDFELILQRVVSSIAVGCIDFRDKGSRKDRSKASYKDTVRLSFYQEFMEKVGCEIKVVVPRKKSSIQKNIAWMRRQVSKSLSIIRDGLGSIQFVEWISQLILIGQEKQKNIDLKVIQYISDHQGVVSIKC